MAAAGVTAFTDATTRNGPVEVEQFAKLAQSNAICQRVGVMIGGQHLDARRSMRADRARRRNQRWPARSSCPAISTITAGLSRPVRRALERGLDCAFHVTEIEELDEAIAAIEVRESAILRAARDAAVSHRARRPHHARLHRPPDGRQRVGRHQSRLHLFPRSQVRRRARPRRASLSRAQSQGRQCSPGRRDRRAGDARQAVRRDCRRGYAHHDRRRRAGARRSALDARRVRAFHHRSRAPRAPRRRRHRARPSCRSDRAAARPVRRSRPPI